MPPTHIKQEIKELYAAFAETAGAEESRASIDSPCHAFSRKCYNRAELSSVPPTALQLACGCGNPVSFKELPPGITVVDLGCGGGMDVVLAARRTQHGKVLGIDMVPGMIRGAQQAVAESGLQLNIFFRVADIEDIYPLPKNFADVVLANCVINLCPDKLTVYKNIFRILRPGGVLILSDTVIPENIDLQARQRIRADRTNCLSGAVSAEEHRRDLMRLTFDILEMESFALSTDDLETIARYPARDSIAPISRADLLSLQGQAAGMTIMAQRRPLN